MIFSGFWEIIVRKHPSTPLRVPNWKIFLPILSMGILNGIPWFIMGFTSNLDARIFFASWGFLALCIGTAVGGFILFVLMFSTSLNNPNALNNPHSLNNPAQITPHAPAQKPHPRSFRRQLVFGGYLPLIILTAALWQGTSMIFSWTLGDSEPFQYVSILNGLGWICGLGAILHRIDSKKKDNKHSSQFR